MLCYIDGRWYSDPNSGSRKPGIVSDNPTTCQANFTTASICEGAWLFEHEHLKRLSHDARALGFRAPSANRIRSVVNEGIKRNRLNAAVVKIIVTAARNGLRVFFAPPRPTPRNVSLVLLESAPTKCSAHKVLVRTQLDFLHRAAARVGCFDALLTDGKHVLETTIANLFVLRRGAVFTPIADGRILAGIARQTLLAERDLNIQERSLRPADIISCDGFFIANSVRGPMPVRSIERQDGALVWKSQPPWTWLPPFRKAWKRIIAAQIAAGR